MTAVRIEPQPEPVNKYVNRAQKISNALSLLVTVGSRINKTEGDV